MEGLKCKVWVLLCKHWSCFNNNNIGDTHCWLLSAAVLNSRRRAELYNVRNCKYLETIIRTRDDEKRGAPPPAVSIFGHSGVDLCVWQEFKLFFRFYWNFLVFVKTSCITIIRRLQRDIIEAIEQDLMNEFKAQKWTFQQLIIASGMYNVEYGWCRMNIRILKSVYVNPPMRGLEYKSIKEYSTFSLS